MMNCSRMAHAVHSTERTTAVLRVLHEVANRTGRLVMYAANLTGDLDEMLRRHDHLVGAGGTCLMVSMNSIGLPAMKALRAHSQLAIHAHRNGWGMLGRSPTLGMSFVAYQKLWRLAGIDHTHVNGLRNKFCESDESVIASARACLHTDVSRAASRLRDHAGLLFRPVRLTGARHLQCASLNRSHLCCRRRHYGTPNGPRCGGPKPSTSVGGCHTQHSACYVCRNAP